MAKKLNSHRISAHRTYDVHELALAWNVHKATVLRWITEGSLKTIDGGRPKLIHGGVAKKFAEARKSQKQKCALDEFYCLRCRKPRKPKEDQAVVHSRNARTINLRGNCTSCGGLMHKRVSQSALPILKSILSIGVDKSSYTGEGDQIAVKKVT